MSGPNPKSALASGEFDRRKANGQQQPGIAPIARLFGISPRQLANYRANYVSRRQIRKPFVQAMKTNQDL